MPSPATPHRTPNRGENPKSATPAKQKPLDIGQPLGVYDTNSVRAKVRKWQQQGGGVVTADEVYYEDDENSTAESKPKTKEKRDSPAVSKPARKRSHSTPRKRVISDEHWKLNRSAIQSHTPPPTKPTPRRIGEYTTNDQFPTPRAAKKDGRQGEKGKSSSHTGEKDRERASQERRKPKPRDDVIEEELTNDEASSLFTRSAPATKSVAEESEWTDPTRRNSAQSEDDMDWAASEADFSELSKKRARGPQKPRLQRPPKGGIFTHMLDESRRMFARPEADSPKPIQPLPTRGFKIESWLSDTPDPFVEEMHDDVDIPAPLNTRPNRARRHHRREGAHDHGATSEPEDTHRRSTRRHRRSSEKDNSPEHEMEKRGRNRKSFSKREITIVSPPDSSKSRERKPSKSPDRHGDDAEKRQEGPDPSETDTLPPPEGSRISENNPPVPLNRKRPFPSTGYHQLSTIPSIDSLSTSADKSRVIDAHDDCGSSKPLDDLQSEERDYFNPDSIPSASSPLRRRLTTHDDLISVLSAPNAKSRSLRSARSIRTNRSRLANATVPDLLKELTADETKYMRELKTLVGGVIPVLLTCVLSKSDSAIAAGLFRPSTDPKDEVNFSKPIVDMGVALERLKAMHKRIPQDNADSLLQWAQGAQRVYRHYLRAWRLGFKDVIVNLAPLEEGEETNESDTKSLDEGLGRDENGDVVDSDGEKVDVAYLLKRPLVRLKYLAKTFKGINMLQSCSKAGEIADAYQALVTEARRRARDERARLEDESAARIDPTRARNPMTLGVLPGVTIDKSRRVRARDFFNLSLYHSTGQVIDCRSELLLRDNVSGIGGDLLICEIDHSDRWLLFPPMPLACVSARNGDSKGEIVVMLRSPPGQADVWRELLSLQIDEEDIAFEWVQLLGLNPVPPTICRSQSFIDRARQRQRNQDSGNDDAPLATPSARDVDVPIGEKAGLRSRQSWTPKEQFSEPSTVSSSADDSKTSTAITRESDYAEKPDSPVKPQPPILHARTPEEKPAPGLKRSKAKRISRYGDSSPSSPTKHASEANPISPPAPRRYYDEHHQHIDQSVGSVRDTKHAKEQPSPQTPTHDAEMSPRLSSVPSMDLPLIPKIRQGSSPSYIAQSVESDSDEELPYESYIDVPDSPGSAKSHSRTQSDTSENDAPPPPPHRTPSSTGSGLSASAPVLSPSAMPRRRGSSPLKHEYEPSTESDSYSDSDTSTVRHYDMYSGSDYSATDTSDDDTDDEFVPPVAQDSKPEIKDSGVTSLDSTSLSPSNSASQGGYRSVPAQPSKSTRAIGSVFAWCDKGSWENLLPGDCNIIVSPGLIEAYEMSSTDPDPKATSPGSIAKGKRPLIALELTPLVPIRRGTAIDISIRSPPTKRSKVHWSNNVMFRSRNADECEGLYSLINQARINNPTYIALQNARGPFGDQPPESFDRPEKTRGLFGWPRRRKSYRASGAPRSLADNSESSVGTMSSAFSALKRFGAGSKMFSIARSTVTSRSGNKEDSLHSSSAGSGSHHFGSSGIGRIAAAIRGSDGIGLSNAKIRLYTRETQTKWRDMGAARLTILPAPSEQTRPSTSGSRRSDGGNPAPAPAPEPSPPASGTASPARPGTSSGITAEKRIVIKGKTRGEVLLDVCLGESSFERVARTGIALSVWEENEGGAVAQKGGVGRGSFRIYMIQMKSEAEAAYTFGLVGKLRY